MHARVSTTVHVRMESTLYVGGGSPASSDSHQLNIAQNFCAIIIIGLDRSRV